MNGQFCGSLLDETNAENKSFCNFLDVSKSGIKLSRIS